MLEKRFNGFLKVTFARKSVWSFSPPLPEKRAYLIWIMDDCSISPRNDKITVYKSSHSMLTAHSSIKGAVRKNVLKAALSVSLPDTPAVVGFFYHVEGMLMLKVLFALMPSLCMGFVIPERCSRSIIPNVLWPELYHY